MLTQGYEKISIIKAIQKVLWSSSQYCRKVWCLQKYPGYICRLIVLCSSGYCWVNKRCLLFLNTPVKLPLWKLTWQCSKVFTLELWFGHGSVCFWFGYNDALSLLSTIYEGFQISRIDLIYCINWQFHQTMYKCTLKSTFCNSYSVNNLPFVLWYVRLQIS